MDLKQIEYILKIAEENNITRAAEKLFITQSALNQQLLRLEKDLGTPLFYRSRTNWRATEAGEVYLKSAKEILQIKHQTYGIIHDIAATKKGFLTVGLTPGRGIAMFSAVYPAFHRKYPDIVVEPREMSVRRQQQEIAQGSLDIGFMTLREKDRTNDSYETIYSEELLLAIPAGHPLGKQAAPFGEPPVELELALLQYEPFVLMYKESTSRSMSDEVFHDNHVVPSVLFETSSTDTIVTMVKAKLCCGLIPEYYIRKSPSGIASFSLKQHPAWDITVSYRSGAYLSQAAKDFIRLAKEYWTALT